MEDIKIKQLDEDADYQFYDITLTHDAKTYGNKRSPAQITINRSVNIINHIENFVISCGRLSFPVLSIPNFVATLQVGTLYSQNLMTFSITMRYLGFTSGQTYLVFVPTDQSATQPGGTVQQAYQSLYPYYYLYTPQDLCLIINNAFTTATNALNVAAGTAFTAPFVYWNISTNSPVLKVNKTDYISTAVNPVFVEFNNEFQSFWNGFQFIDVTDNDANGSDNQFLFYDNGTNTTDATYLYAYPFSYTYEYMNPVASLNVITSMPINYELINPINYDYGGQTTLSTQQTQNQNVNPSTNILIDFIPDFQSISNNNAIFIYNKNEDWQFQNFISSGGLRSFTLNLYWSDKAGNNIPLYLIPYMNATLKLAFIKRNIFDQNSTKIFELLKKIEKTDSIKITNRY